MSVPATVAFYLTSDSFLPYALVWHIFQGLAKP